MLAIIVLAHSIHNHASFFYGLRQLQAAVGLGGYAAHGFFGELDEFCKHNLPGVAGEFVNVCCGKAFCRNRIQNCIC